MAVPARREEILHAYQERTSLRGLTLTFGVSRTTVATWIKKSSSASPLRITLVVLAPKDPTSTILEPYRLWSFVLKKASHSWIWIDLCRKTRQVIAYAIRDRSKKT